MNVTLSLAEAESIIRTRERFGVRLGTERIQRLLGILGYPQKRYPSIHIVGTNGKSTTARALEEVLRGEGLTVGTYLSPHVTSFSERFRVGGNELDICRVVGPILEAVEEIDRDMEEPVTQFELLTAAALFAFAEHKVDVSVIEAGLGGRHDATNVIDAGVVVLTNVALDHQRQLGMNRMSISEEKLAVLRPGSTLVLGDSDLEGRAREIGAGCVIHAATSYELAHAAAEAYLDRKIHHDSSSYVSLPGRLEVVNTFSGETWDGAHNPHAVEWLAKELEEEEYVIVLSILSDKDIDGMLKAFATIGRSMIATGSSNPRALSGTELAEWAHSTQLYDEVFAINDPVSAREFGLRMAEGKGRPLLVSGSLYLLHDLFSIRA